MELVMSRVVTGHRSLTAAVDASHHAPTADHADGSD